MMDFTVLLYDVPTEFKSQYWNSRRNRDIKGNNCLHYVFQIEDAEIRYKFLDLLLDAEIGSLDEPNTLGYFPQDSEHVYPIDNLP